MPGIGDLLADGLPAAAEKMGQGAEEHLLAAKGSSSDMHIAPLKAIVLAAAVSPIGKDDRYSLFSTLFQPGGTSRRKTSPPLKNQSRDIRSGLRRR